MDFRRSPAQPPQHQQDPASYNNHQLPPYNYQQPPPPQQVMLMPSQLTSYPPQFVSNNDHTNNNIGLIQQQNPSFHFNSVPQRPLDSLNSQFTDGSLPSPGIRTTELGNDSAKKKRGRPRKYSIDVQDSEQSSKKARGRPAGSGKKKNDVQGSAGVGFMPHVINVAVGEDIASKIMAFTQQGQRTICILSANGTIGSVTLRQTTESSSSVSFEGGFEILCMSGSFSLSDNTDEPDVIGSLSVSLAGPGGQVLGGVVAGELKAATPVQVIVGSFIADGKKLKSGLSLKPPRSMSPVGASGPGVNPPFRGASSESSDGSGNNQLNRTTGLNGSVNEPITPRDAQDGSQSDRTAGLNGGSASNPTAAMDASGHSQLNSTIGPNGSASEPITSTVSNMAWANSTTNTLPN